MSARRVFRPAVLRRIPLDRHAVIEASAGTGKTFTLEHLAVEILLSTDATLDRILVVTFTEKATNELRLRLRAKVEELLSGGGDSPDEGQLRAGDFWTIDDAARGRLARALHAFDGATISTIHAFCQRVLRENAFASGRLFDEQQVDGRDSFGRAMRAALRSDIACDSKRAAWLEIALGGGWSIDRIEELLWRCVQARGELRPEFDGSALEAAIESFPMEDARRSSAPEEIRRAGLPAQTAKAVARRLYEMAGAVERARIARSAPAFVLEAQDIKLSYLVDKLQNVSLRPGPAATLCAAALTLARETPPFPAALAHALLGPVKCELARGKREAGQYDFDDMLALVDDALRGPRAGALVNAMRARWRYALIDEFQDTDETQWSIFRRAFFERGELPTVVYLVGDPKQSIYRFRGADVQTYLRARDEVVAAGGERIPLESNYRATKALVRATNGVFDQGAPDPIFTGDIQYAPVACGRPDRALVDGEGHDVTPVHVFRFGAEISLSELGALIAREVRLVTDPLRPWKLDGRALEHQDIYVVTRNAREGRIVGVALRAAGVPHAFYKEEGLFQTGEAKELRTLLTAIDDPADRARRLAAWLTPFFGMSLVDVERARELPASDPLVARLHAWRALADARDFGGLFESIVVDSGILRREIFFADGERELTNYLHVIERLLEHARRTHATLRELLYELSGLIDETRLSLDLEGNVQRLEGERRAVQIMTIHKSKGLEASIVFVAGGFWPSRIDEVRVYHDGGQRLVWAGPIGADIDARVKAEEREEEQRLMYVALTRAKGRLYLPCAATKSPRGPYGIVNRRLVELAASGDFSVEDVVVRSAPPPVEGSSTQDAWQPSSALLREDDEGAEYASLRERHAGAIVTSYTRMRGARASAHASWTEQPEDIRAEKASEAVDEAPETTLRSARTSGIFLHELLERVPLATFAEPAGFDGWRARPDVSSLFDEAIAAHRVDRAQREHAERLVWSAYKTPALLPGGARIDGFAAPARTVREMQFVFPASGADLSSPAPSPMVYVRGSLDMAFEHGGRTYFVDWKSDSLASYALDTLGRHVRAHYEEQAKLYAIAIAKLLGVSTRDEHEARFGGLLYCFLRGFDANGRGLWSARPTWDDLVSWEQALRVRRRWGTGSSA